MENLWEKIPLGILRECLGLCFCFWRVGGVGSISHWLAAGMGAMTQGPSQLLIVHTCHPLRLDCLFKAGQSPGWARQFTEAKICFGRHTQISPQESEWGISSECEIRVLRTSHTLAKCKFQSSHMLLSHLLKFRMNITSSIKISMFLGLGKWLLGHRHFLYNH